MEEKVQEMLNKINEKYNDFEIKSVDLSLLRKLENLANKIAFNSLLRELCCELLHPTEGGVSCFNES
jgi:hypothetical protein